MSEPLALLLLPAKLEDFELATHASDLLEIPRVLALEPPRFRRARMFGEMVAVRQALRLKLPGEPRVAVLYHPRQYPLARALAARFESAEIWYARPGSDQLESTDPRVRDQLVVLDEQAVERAASILEITPGGDVRAENAPLRRRLVELEVISSKPFVPGAHIQYK